MRMTDQQVRDHEMRQALKCPIHVRRNPACHICCRISQELTVPLDAVDLEAPLQEQIEAECRRRGWPFVRTRMSKATTFTFPGVPDFVIAAAFGKTLWIEAKTRTGKQTAEQLGFQMMLNKCGHVLHVVRSYSQFLKIISDLDGVC